MSSSKKSAGDQMGSGESDDEFYKMNASDLNKNRDAGKGPSRIVDPSPKRMKIQYDYKFDSSSDESDGTSARQNTRSVIVRAPDSKNRSEKVPAQKESKIPAQKESKAPDDKETKVPDKTTVVVEKSNEESKSVKTVDEKAKKDTGTTTEPSESPQLMSPSPACVPPPVVVVPQPIIVSQTHSVMAMASGMIVPPPMGLPNQNVMMPPPNLLNMPGNVMRPPNAMGGIMAAGPGGAVMSMGMTNDILQLQGNFMGLGHPGSMMPMPGICVAGNMFPVQGALPGNIMRYPGPPGAMMGPGGVMINTGSVMTVTNVVGGQGPPMGTPENMMMRMNYPGNVVSAQGVNNVNVKPPSPPKEVKMHDSQTQVCAREWRVRSKVLRKRKSLRKIKRNDGTRVAKQGEGEDDDVMEELVEEEIEEEELEGGDLDDGEEEEESDDGDEEEEEEKVKEETKEHKNPPVRESANTFKNDGSFMEMFKKMNEANTSKASSNKAEKTDAERKEAEIANMKRPTVLISGIVGKRRGGRVLKTGLVKKVKKENENEEGKGPKDAWAVYMAEVKKYREASCEEEGKTRPLVK